MQTFYVISCKPVNSSCDYEFLKSFDFYYNELSTTVNIGDAEVMTINAAQLVRSMLNEKFTDYHFGIRQVSLGFHIS